MTGCTKSSDKFSGILGDANGGTGTASVSISSFSPGSSSVIIKDVSSQQFIVSATGHGTLLYTWTLDGTVVGSDSPTFTLTGADYSIGNKTLKLVISDDVGSTTQSWTVKINGSPVINSSTPSPASVNLRESTQQNYSVSVSDPNSDTLTYDWKLDGQENVLTSTTNNTNWTPAAVDVGTHTISVDIYDGPVSDTGTYKVTRSWTTYVNNFNDACNTMENNTQTNKVCVYVGISGIGDGLDPSTAASSFYIRPASLAKTADNNLFIGDDINHVIWFYNLHTSPSITILGVTVPLNTMKVVAGVGVGTNSTSGSNKALRNLINSPHGLYWDGTYLYFSDTSNNQVARVDSAGVRTNIITSGCTSPRGLTMVGSKLYVACYSNNIIMTVDTGTLATATFAGISGGAADPANLIESTFTDPTDGKLNGPYGLASDVAGNIYLGEYGGCRIRIYNQSGGTLTLFGSWVVDNNRQRTIVGQAAPSCSLTTGNPTTTGRTGNVRTMMFDSNGLLLWGTDQDTISGLNFASSSAALFGVTIAGYNVKSMLGSGTAGYVGENQLPTVTRFNNPFAIIDDTTTGDYYIADNGNLRLRKIKAADNTTALIAGNGNTRAQTNAGQGQLNADQEKMNSVRGLAVDSVTGEVFIADSGNNRIRVLNRYGQVNQAAGTGGSGTGAEEDEFPSNITMNQPRGLTLVGGSVTFGGHLVWADSQNNRIRIYNRSTTSQTLFGVTVDGGRVATIGGDGTVGNATTGTALQSAFNSPGGVTTDGTNLYVSDTNNHCVKKIDSSGQLSVVAGICGSAGFVNGPLGSNKLNSPEGIDYYNFNGHQGVLIADRGNGRVRFYRMAGSALLFGGSTTIGDTNTIACGGSFHTEDINAQLAPCSGVYDVTALNGNGKVCFTNFSYHNARCLLSTGEITTVLGPPEGIDNTTNLFFPAGSFSSDVFNATSPNYTSQNGVTSFFLPSPLAEPSLNDSFGHVAFPMSIRPIDSLTLLVGEYYLGLIRKVKLP